jgi:hypothetical protein
MLNLTVEPLDGSPPLEQTVVFTPAAALGNPLLTSSRGGNNFAGAWLDNKVDGVAGDTTVGYLTLSIPAGASKTAAYRVRFGHASASPNGLALFPKQTRDGLLTLQDRTGSSLGDGIPDSWRLRYFGSLSNTLAQASVDADGDGASNWAEFMAGTNPADPKSVLGVTARLEAPDGHLTLRWSTVLNKAYVLESSPTLGSPNWSTIQSGLTGTGGEMQFNPNPVPPYAQFFRVRLVQ